MRRTCSLYPCYYVNKLILLLIVFWWTYSYDCRGILMHHGCLSFCLSRFWAVITSLCIRSPYCLVDFPVDLKGDTVMLVREIDPSRFFLGGTPTFVSKLKFFLGYSGGWKSTLSRKTSRKPTSKFVSDFVRRQSKNRLVPLRSGIHNHNPPPPRLFLLKYHDVPRRHTNERTSTNCHRALMRRRSSCPSVGGRRPASGQY